MEPAELLSRLPGWDGGRGHRSARLSRALARAIEDGRVPLGTRLPAERHFADVLGVSRGTVVRAYASLREQGHAHTRQGSGTYAGGPGDRSGRAAELARSLSVSGTAALTERDDDAIDLRFAAWSSDAETLRLAQAGAPGLRPADLPDHGYWPLGLAALREAVAGRLTSQGLPTTADQVLITNGAQQAIDLVLATLAGYQDTVLVPEVTWPGTVELLAIRGLRPLTVPRIGDHELDQVALLSQLRDGRSPLAYLVPSFDNPTGAVLPAPVRRLAVEAAIEGGTVLLDDQSPAELWIDAPPPLPLAAMLPEAGQHVVTVGSLSKLAWGGLRIGWLRAEGPLFDRLARVKAAVDLGNPVAAQLAALRLMPDLDRLVTVRREELGRRRDALTAALGEALPSWRFTPPAGGLSVWVDLGGVACEGFVAAAAEHGVRLAPGRIHHALGHETGHVRLPLSHDAGTLEEAVSRLADAWAAHLGRARKRPVALV
jgi:DNA-binding transcriptional MocR family regulator